MLGEESAEEDDEEGESGEDEDDDEDEAAQQVRTPSHLLLPCNVLQSLSGPPCAFGHVFCA